MASSSPSPSSSLLFILSCLLLLSLFVCLSSSATITFSYDFEDTSAHQWTDTATWEGGVVPGADDDVVIRGASQGSSVNPQSLVFPSTVTVHSLLFDAQDILISLPAGCVVNTANITFDDQGVILSGTTTSTFVVSSALVNNNGVVSITGANFNMSSGSTGFWYGGAAFTNVVLNNMGTWTWNLAYGFSVDQNLNGPFTINNYNNMILACDEDSYEPALEVYGNFNNFAGTLTIQPLCTLEMGRPDNPEIQWNFHNWAHIDLQGTFFVTDASNATMHAGGTVTRTGTISMMGYGGVYPYLYLDQDFEINYLNLIGYVRVFSNNYSLNITTLNILGGSFAGKGPITVYNVTGDGTDNNIESAFYISGRNLTVTGYFTLTPRQVYMSQGAWIITAPSSNVYMWSAMEFSPLDGDNSVMGFLSYGYWYPNPFTFAYVGWDVPAYFYGTYDYPVDWFGTTGLTGTGTPDAFIPDAGGVFGGTLTATLNIIGTYYSDDSEWVVVFDKGPFDILPTAKFFGGVTDFAGDCSGNDLFTVLGCYHDGLYTWEGREPNTTVGDAILVNDVGSTFFINGPNIVFENFWAQGGQVAGPYNLTVWTGIFDNGNTEFTSNWQINGTSVIVTQSFNGTNGIGFFKGGKLIIQKGAVLNGDSITDFQVADPPAGIYNYGETHLSVEQGESAAINCNFWNFGDLYLEAEILESESEEAWGTELDIGSSFVQSADGTIHLHVYSPSDYDSITWNSYAVACTFSGNIELNFQLNVPSAYDSMAIIVNNGIQACGGLMNITTVNLPAGFTVVMDYDHIPESEEAVYHYAVVCPNTNSSCLNMKRDPNNINPTSSSSSSSTTSDQSSTSSSPSSSSSSSSSPTSSTSSASSSSPDSSTTNANDQGSSASFLFVSSPFLFLISAFMFLI